MASIWDEVEKGALPRPSSRSLWDEIENGPQPTKSRTRNPLEFANDTVVTGVNAGLGLGKSISDFISVDNPVSRGLQYVIDEGKKTQSDVVQQADADLEQAMQGDWQEQLKGVGKYVVQNPIQTAAQVVGNLGPIGRGIKATTTGAKMLGLGEKAVTRAGIGAGAAIGGAAGGGDAAGDAYAQIMASPNVDPDAKEMLARQAARDASVLPAVIGVLTGGTGLEKVLAKGFTKKAAQEALEKVSIPKLAAKEFGSEAFEEGATKLSANMGARQFDSSIDPWAGVAGSSALGGVMGAAGGGGVAYLNNRAVPTNLLGGANPSPETQQQPVLGLNYSPLAGTPIIFPDGSVALNGEQELQKRYGTVPDAAAAPADPIPNMSGESETPPAGAAPAASAVFSAEENELIGMGVKPTPKSVALLAEMKASGLSEDQLSPVITAMSETKFRQAKKLLADAIIEARKTAAQETTDASQPSAPAVGTPASSVGASPVVDGSMGNPGPVPDVQQPVGGDALGAGAANPQAGAVAEPSVQQPAVVESPAADPLSMAWEDHKDDNAGTFDQLPANQKEIWRQAVEARAAGKQVNLYKIAEELGGDAVDPRQEILRNVFGERNGNIIFDKFALGDTEAAIAERYGMSPQNVQKIAGATGQKGWAGKFAAAKSKYGYTDEQIAAALAPKANEASLAGSEVESEIFNQELTMDPLMAKEAGLDSLVETAGGGKANIGAKLDADEKRMFAALEALQAEEAKGDAASKDKLAELRAEIDKQVQRVMALEERAQAEVRETAGKEPITDAERAAKAWNKHAKDFDGAPLFSELTPDQQERFVEYGPENWEASDVVTELARIQREGESWAVKSGKTESLTDLNGNDVNVVESELSKLEVFPGVRDFLRAYDRMGLGHVLNSVQGWYVTSAPVDWDGSFSVINGKPSVIFNIRALNDADSAAWTGHHETAHAFDQVHTEKIGRFSGDGVLNLSLADGKITARGVVSREVLAHYEAEPNSPLSTRLVYPLDLSQNADLNATKLRQEIFAQLWAAYNTNNGREWMEDNLPATAEYLESVHEELKASQPAQASGAAQGAQWNAKSGQVRQERPTVPAQAKEQVGFLTKVLKSASDAALNTVVFTEDLFARAVAKGMKSAKTMQRIYQERARMVGEAERKVAQIEQLYNRIPDAEKGTGARSANLFLYDSTREGKWGFKPDWRSGPGANVKVDPAMAARWSTMSKESKAWVAAVLKHGDEMLATKKQVLTEATNSEYDGLIAEAKAAGNTDRVTQLEATKRAQLKQFGRLFAQTEFMPYAPMKRFGDFVVVAKSAEYKAAEKAGDSKKLAEMEKDPDHYHVSFAESRASAMELQRELEGEFGAGNVDARKKEDQRGQMYNGLLSAFTKLRSDIDSQLANSPDSKEKAALTKAREMVVDMYLQSLAEASSRKSEMRRRGVSGDIDMLRSFSTQGRADAHFLAAAKYNPQTMDAINAMRQESKAGDDQLAKSEIFTEVLKRHNQSLTYTDNTWAERAARATSLWMLATSPAYYLQNLTQPLMLSVPYMAGRHNYLKSVAAMTKAYTQLGGLFKGFKLNESFDYSNVPSDVRTVIKTLVDRGRIDIGLDTELGNARIEGESKLAKTGKKVDEILRISGQKMEALNRVSTAMAAYRMELARTGSVEEATEYADKVIAQTHGDYTRINAPRAFNTGAGKVALQFRKFQLIQLTLLTKLVKNSIDSSNPEERAAARKALGFTLAHTGVMAGLVGMPGFAAIAFIVGKLADLFGDDDEPYNLEKELRSAIGDEDMANLILRGAPTLANMDVSGKVGMGNALSVLPFTDFEATREGVNAVMAAAAFGAFGSLVGRQAEGLNSLAGGDYYRGLEKMLPKGMSDAIRSYREATDGVTRPNGDVLVNPDEITAWETFQKAIGFSPASESKRRFDANVKYDTTKAFKDKGDKLKNQYAKAAKQGDSDAMAKARDGWNRLQESRVEEGLKREPMSMLLRAPAAQAQRERNTIGGIQFDKNTRRFVETLTQE